MKSLETFTGQEFQALQKTIIKRFESIEELVRIDKLKEEVQAKDLATPVPLQVRDDLTIVLATYSVIVPEKPSNTQCPNGTKKI